MSDEPKIPDTQSGRDSAPRTTVPMWIFSLTLVLIYLCAVYFDHHGGWFDARVYAPYGSAEQVDAYQPKSGAEALRAQGKKTYEFVCGTCHGADGLGKPGQYPPLAGSEWVNAKGDHRLAEIPLLGINGTVHVKGQEWNASMAPMGAQLSDADLAGVLTYIRTSWGNNDSPVTPDDVKSVRAAVAGHPTLGGEAQLKTLPE